MNYYLGMENKFKQLQLNYDHKKYYNPNFSKEEIKNETNSKNKNYSEENYFDFSQDFKNLDNKNLKTKEINQPSKFSLEITSFKI